MKRVVKVSVLFLVLVAVFASAALALNVAMQRPLSWYNISGSYLFNATSDNAGSVALSANFSLYRVSDGQLMVILNASNSSDGSTNFNVTYDTTGLPDGLYNVTANITDTLGSNWYNDSLYSFNITIDNTAPTVTLQNTSLQFITRDTKGLNLTFNFTDNLFVNANCTLFLNDTEMNTSIVMSGADIMYNYTTDNAFTLQGNYTANISCKEHNGNMIGYSANINIVVDDTVPAVTLVSPALYSNHSTGSVLFNATVTDAVTSISQVVFSITNGSSTINLTGILDGTNANQYNVSWSALSFSQGTHLVTIIANDSMNNINNTVTTNFTVDYSVPSVTSVSPAAFANISTGNILFNATVTDTYNLISAVYFSVTNGSSTINLTGVLDGANANQYNVSYAVSSLAEGLHVSTVVANDTQNNVNSTVSVNFTVDYSAPVLVYNITPATASLGSTISINSTWTDYTLQNCSLYVNTVFNKSEVHVGTSCNMTYTIGQADYEAGAVNFTIEARDFFNLSTNSSDMTTSVTGVPCGTNISGTFALNGLVDCSAGGGYGLRLAPNTILTCSNNIILGSGSGIGLNVTGSNIVITGCNVTTFASGIQVFNGANNVTLTYNNLSVNTFGVELYGDATNITLSNNNIFSSTTYGLKADNANIYDGITVDTNFWGHSTCSLFEYMVDSDSGVMYDTAPVSEFNDWTSTINCSANANTDVVKNIWLLNTDGSRTDNTVSGDTTITNGSGTIDLTTAWDGIYSEGGFFYYYYPYSINNSYAEPIAFDVNLTPSNYNISTFTAGVLVSSVCGGTPIVTVSAVSPTVYGARGVYRVNITNCWLNMSDPDYINTTSGVSTLPLHFLAIDNVGYQNGFQLYGTYNFTPAVIDASLGGDTTDWSTISDYTNVSNLVFHAMDGAIDVGRLMFLNYTNLADMTFIAGLQNLATHTNITNLSADLNSDALAALNLSTNITFYGVNISEGGSQLNASELLAKVKLNGEACPTTVCTDAYYNATTLDFNFTVSHWSRYIIDTTVPTVTASSPSSTQAAGTTAVTLSATTDESATCKYDTSDVAYASMDDTMTGSSTTHTATESVTDGGSYTFYVRCIDSVNNVMTSSEVISFSVDEADDESGGSSGGSSGTASVGGTSSASVLVTLPAVVAGQEVIFAIGSEGVDITEITLVTNADAKQAGFTVKQLTSLPSTVGSAPGTVFGNLQIDPKNIVDSNVKEAIITFQVSVEWLTANNIDPATVALYRYVGDSWVKLSTTLVGKGSGNYEFEAITPGFSYFAIAGTTAPAGTPVEQQPVVPEETATERAGAETLPAEPAEAVQENVVVQPEVPLMEEKKSMGATAWTVIILLLVVALGTFFYHKGRKGKAHHDF